MFFYFNSEVNAGFFYKSAEEREKLVSAERAFITERVKKVIELKKKVCDGNDRGFVVINQKVTNYLTKIFSSFISKSSVNKFEFIILFLIITNSCKRGGGHN